MINLSRGHLPIGHQQPHYADMDKLLAVLSKISERFQRSNAGPEHFFKDKEANAAYYTSMFLIQDTGESVACHMKRGFSSVPSSAYIEFWGVMQAIFIQQDAICELHKAIVGPPPQIQKGPNWSAIRDIRNTCAGHPAHSNATQRTFLGRRFGTYAGITYELWDAKTQQSTYPTFNLAAMIKAYDAEAAIILNTVFDALKTKWPPPPA